MLGAGKSKATLPEPQNQGRLLMKHLLPMEEIANQRLRVLVNAYTLFVKNLKDEGVDLEKVKAASDKTWAALGVKAGQDFKEFYKDAPAKDALFTSGSIVAEIHEMQVKEEMGDIEKHVEISKCPWNEAAQAFNVPAEWRLCKSGHEAFSATMLQTIEPSARFEMSKWLTDGDHICEERVAL
jgi:hypothetical protein